MNFQIKHLARAVIPVFAFLLLLGCSSSQTDDVEEPSDDLTEQTDQSEYTETETETEAEEAPVPEKTGPGSLKIVIKSSGQDATGNIRILTAEVDPQLVDEGPAGRSYQLKAGNYDVEVTMDTTLDKPQKRLRDVRIKAGELTEREINFPVGTIKLIPKRGRRKVGSKLRWRYAGGGDWFEKSTRVGEPITLSCGRYDAEVQIGRMKIVIADVQVYEGSRTVSAPVTMR